MVSYDSTADMRAFLSLTDPAAVFERIGAAPFIGRQVPLRIAERAIRSAIAGEGSTLVLCGEAGVGKSRLIRETVRFAREGGALPLRAECLVEPDAPPYDVWIRALRGLPDATAVTLLEGSSAGGGGNPYNTWQRRKIRVEEARFRLFSDLVAALERAARRQPLLICLDDLQWADLSSVLLFQFVAQRAATLPVVLLGAVRSEEMPPEAEIARAVETLHAGHKAVRVDLAPFSAGETRSLLDALLDGASPELAAMLHRQSEGNPFVLEETIRLLAAPEGLPGHGAIPLPAGVSASIRMRIDRLDASEREMLDVAAVAGKRFDAAIVAGALGIDPPEAEQRLERLCERSMLRRDGLSPGSDRYAFLHDRFRDAVLDALTASRRRSLHLRLAGILERAAETRDDPELIGTLAHHYQMAELPEAAAGYLTRLGDLSMARNAPAEAARAYQTALELLRPFEPDPAAAAQLELALGSALLATGKRGAAEAFGRAGELYRRAGRLRDAAGAIDRQAQALAADEQHELALATYQRAIDALAADGAPETALHQAAVLVHMSETVGPGLGRYDEALRAQRQALLLLPAGARGDQVRAEGSLALARTLMRINRLREAREVIEQALPATVKSGDLVVAAELEGARANVAYWQGDVRESRTCTLRRLAYAEAAGDFLSKRHINAWLALIEIGIGNWAEAERLLAEADRDVSGFDSAEPAAFTRQIRGHLAFVRGDYAMACQCMCESFEAFHRMGAATALWYAGYAARACHAAGRVEESQALQAEAWTLLDELPPAALSRAATLSELGLLAVEQGDRAHCDQLYDALTLFAGEFHWHLDDRALGEMAATLGRREAALEHFEAAIAQARRHGLRPELALARAQRSALLPGSVDCARDQAVDQSLDRLRSLGLLGDARRLDEQTAPPAARGDGNPARLTDREIEVLRLVAAGLTNREIAGRLDIAEKTVTNHITHILDKVGLENRAAAAVFAVRHGLA
jgi:predicted ATPase/DNA-binding CsgD family transcriptional regulator